MGSIFNTNNIVSSDYNIFNNNNSTNYSKIANIAKIYKPDYSGEEQEAWLVSNSVWTQISGVGIEPVKLNMYKGKLLDITLMIGKTIANYTGEEDCLLYCSSNSVPYNKIYKIHNTTYVCYLNTQLYIRADKVAEFDDNITWDDSYASKLYYNIEIKFNGNILAWYSQSTSPIPWVHATTNNNGTKYILVEFNPQVRSSNYRNDGFVGLEVYI